MVHFNSYLLNFGVCFLLGLIFHFAITFVSQDSLGEFLFTQPEKKIISDHHIPWYSVPRGWQLAVGLVFTIYFGVYQADVDLIKLLDKESIQQAGRMFAELSAPDWSIFNITVLKTIETIYMAFIATFIAVPIAFVLGFFSAKNIMSQNLFSKSIYYFLRTIFNITRSIEPILWAIIFSIWVEVGPFAGMLALTVHSVASLAKQYSELVECVDNGPIDGVQSTGASFLQTIWFAIVPQVTLPFISFTIYRWDINVRMATIIGFVGGGGVGQILMQYQLQSQWPKVGCIILVIAFVVWIMDLMSTYVRESLR